MERDTSGRDTSGECDRALLERTRGGDKQAFAELVHRYLRLVMAVARASVGRYEAEDLTQEVFMEAWRSVNSLRSPERFAGWLIGIARRMAVYHLRCRKREAAAFDALGRMGQPNPGLEATPPSKIEEDEAMAALEEQLQALPETYREILLLRYLAGLNIEEMAVVLDISRAACDKRLVRAKQRLKELVKKKVGET